MLLFKIYYHIQAYIYILIYKIIYARRLQIGKSTTFRKGFTLIIEDKGKVQIGSNCFFNNYCSIASIDRIKIGNDCLLGENVKVYDHNHRYKNIQRPIKEQGYSSSPIIIGNHCWIGSNVTILKGVTIGDNAVIGAGCVIHMDVPGNTVVINKQSLTMQSY